MSDWHTLDIRMNHGSQSINYQEITRYVPTGQRFEISIKADSVDYQSYARIKMWTGKKWERVATIPYPHIETNPDDRFSKVMLYDMFAKDVSTLKDLARSVVVS